jgi:hypothetical protein
MPIFSKEPSSGSDYPTSTMPIFSKEPSSGSDYPTSTMPILSKKPSSGSDYPTSTMPIFSKEPSSGSDYPTSTMPILSKEPSSGSDYPTSTMPILSKKPSSGSDYPTSTMPIFSKEPSSGSDYPTSTMPILSKEPSSGSDYPTSTMPTSSRVYVPTRAPTKYLTSSPFSTLTYPQGVQYNKAKTKKVLAAKGCTQCYSESYSKITTTDDVENLCKGDWLFVSATGPFFLGAFGTRAKVLMASDGHVSNNVTWFHQPGHAFGFNVKYGGIYWPLNGLPGSRVGEFDDVVSNIYRKHIFSCPE